MEKFLKRSVESLLDNDYPNKEIILVNDGSSDATKDIIDEYAALYPSIVAIHQENAGVAAARNRGMEIANGKYIMFVDPDDYVRKEFIRLPVEKIEDTGTDMVVFGYSTPWFSRPQNWIDYSPIQKYEYSNRQDIIKEVLPLYFGMSKQLFELWLSGEQTWGKQKELPTIWRFIFRKEFIDVYNLRYRPLRNSEDVVFILDCLSKANSLHSIDDALYMYEPLAEGALAKAMTPERAIATKTRLLEERRRIAKELEKEFGKSYIELYSGSTVIASLQTAYSICNSEPLSIWTEFNKQIMLKESLQTIQINYSGGIKRWLPILMLKLGLHSLVYTMLKLAHKFGVSSGEWD